MARNYRHFKDTRIAHLLRNHAARSRPSSESGDSSPTMEELCEGEENVFATLGLPHPEQELLKALLTIQVYSIIKERNLTQVQAAEVLGIKQQQVSELKHNRLSKFSIGLLIEFLAILGQDVDIAIRPARGERGQVSLNRIPSSRHSFLPKLRSFFVRRPQQDE